jgi:hypothetical protein
MTEQLKQPIREYYINATEIITEIFIICCQYHDRIIRVRNEQIKQHGELYSRHTFHFYYPLFINMPIKFIELNLVNIIIASMNFSF